MIKNKIFKVGIYLRLSREDENHGESGSISTQRDILLNYIKENSLVLGGEYVDDGVSGTTFERTGFKQMIHDIENKKINMVITKDTSRLGRDHIEFGYYVERFFPENNIRYVAVNDGVDTFSTNNSANDMLVFKSAFNDMYVKDISNKLRSSLYIKKRNGLFVGAYAPYGYKKSKDDKHKLEIDSRSAAIVKRIFNMFISGYNLSKICDTLTLEHVPTPSMYKNMKLGQNNVHYGVWSPKTVFSILTNPTYIGNLTQGRQKKINYKSKKRIHTNTHEWIIAEGKVEPIIDKEIFGLARNMFKRNKNRSGDGITDKLLLRGLIYCKECGHTIGFRKQVQQTKKHGLVCRIYGNCNYWIKRKKQNVCTPHSVKYQDIEDAVINNLRQLLKKHINQKCLEDILKSSKKLKKQENNIRNEIFEVEQAIVNINKKIDACYNDKLEGNITLDIFKRTFNSLKLENNNLKKQKETLEKKLNTIKKNENPDHNCYEKIIKEFIEIKKPSKELICSLIDRIEIDENNNIDVHYRFKL